MRLACSGGMNRLGRVSSKGQVVIAAELREKLKITRTVLIREDGGKIVMEPWVSMEEAFGSGGKEMIDAAIEISRDRRREVESERRSYAFGAGVIFLFYAGVPPVRAFLDRVLAGRAPGFVSEVNLAELYCKTAEKKGVYVGKSSTDRSGGHP